jgi:hypothetical protein
MANSNDQIQKDIAEYQAAQGCVLHYDKFTWQVGAVLIAGTFVFWGFLISSNFMKEAGIGTACLLVNLVMTMWILYAQYNRQIFIYKLERIYELEENLHMEQHRRFSKCKRDEDVSPKYKPSPRGVFLDCAIYSICSLGGVLIASLKIRLFDLHFWVIGLLVAGVLIWVFYNTRHIDKEIEDRRKSREEREGDART